MKETATMSNGLKEYKVDVIQAERYTTTVIAHSSTEAKTLLHKVLTYNGQIDGLDAHPEPTKLTADEQTALRATNELYAVPLGHDQFWEFHTEETGDITVSLSTVETVGPYDGYEEGDEDE